MLKQTALVVWLGVAASIVAASLALAQRANVQEGFGPQPVSGTVVDVKAAQRAIQVGSETGEAAEWMLVAAGGTIMKPLEAKLSDLREGDEVSVTGWPSAILVSEITLGMEAVSAPTGGQGGPGGPGGAGPAPARRRNEPQPPVVTGRIISLDPLKIAVGRQSTEGSVPQEAQKPLPEISLTMGDESKVMRVTKVDLSQVQPGDTIVATGQRDDQGMMIANSVFVNMGAGMRGFMGMGGGRGGRR